MAIAFVQKTTGQGVGVNSFSFSAITITAGSLLVTTVSIWDNGTPPNATPTSTPTNTWNTTTAPTANNGANAFINYAMNAASGSTTVSIDYGTGFYCECALSEYSGIATSSALDVQTSNSADSTTPTSGTTGATAQADELVVASCQVSASNSNVGLDVPATTGYTNLHVQQDSNSTIGHASDYKIVAAAGTQSAAWGTLSGTYAWSAKICTFKGAAAAAANNPRHALIAHQAVMRASVY